MLVVRSAAPRGSDEATETVLGNDLTVQLMCISYPANDNLNGITLGSLKPWLTVLFVA
jgi:hypothetical protein